VALPAISVAAPTVAGPELAHPAVARPAVARLGVARVALHDAGHPTTSLTESRASGAATRTPADGAPSAVLHPIGQLAAAAMIRLPAPPALPALGLALAVLVVLGLARPQSRPRLTTPAGQRPAARGPPLPAL
jgi:hypothetical protein